MEYTISSQMYCLLVCLCVFLVFFRNILKQVRETRRFFTQGWERLGCADQMCELLYQDGSAHRHLDFASTKRILCTTLPLIRLMISIVICRYSSYCFEMMGSFSTKRYRVVLNSIRLEYSLQVRNSFEIRKTLG